MIILCGLQPNSRKKNDRFDFREEAEAQPLIHLLDGGISDNPGIRVLVNLTRMQGHIWNKLKKLDLEKTGKLALIVVNAQNAFDRSFTMICSKLVIGVSSKPDFVFSKK